MLTSICWCHCTISASVLLLPHCRKSNNRKGLSHLILHYRIGGHCSSICTSLCVVLCTLHRAYINCEFALSLPHFIFLPFPFFLFNHITDNSMHEVNSNSQIKICYLVKKSSKVSGRKGNRENPLRTQTVRIIVL